MQADWRIFTVFSADWLAWVRFRNSTVHFILISENLRNAEHPRNVPKMYATVLVNIRQARIIYFLRCAESPLLRVVLIFVSLAKLRWE